MAALTRPSTANVVPLRYLAGSDLEEMLTFYDCPAKHWIKIRTTNVIERCFREVRRRVRPMTLFSNPRSCDRIIFAIFHRLSTEWRGHPLPELTQNP